MLNGVFPKSECKGIHFSDTLQIFQELFLKIYRLLIQIKRKGGFLGFIGHNGHDRHIKDNRHIRHNRHNGHFGVLGLLCILRIVGRENRL